MKLCVSHLVATALAALLVATALPSTVGARPATLLIFDNQLSSNVKVQWATTISYNGRTLSSTEDVTKVTTEGYHEFPVPAVSGCGAIRASTRLSWVQGNRSDQRCSRPTMDITSASTGGSGQVYCANTYYRSCSVWRCTCKTAFSIRAILLDEGGRYMTVSRPGNFNACGVLTNEERVAAKKVAAKRLSR